VSDARETLDAGDESAARSKDGPDPWRRFVLIFAVLAVLSEVLYYGVALESEAFQHYLNGLASVSGFILTFFTEGVTVRGASIQGANFSVEIARGCDAYRICSLLSAAIIAFPSRWRVKIWGLLLGLLWLNFLNFVRIIGLFFIGGHSPKNFQASHEIYFPVFLICMTVLAWILWVRQATHEAIPRESDAA
jgi:exosortase H (IPTLxxWG-CTERM-specific)